VHASIENNDALFNMMAQGRAASVQMILATQTISDIAAKTDKPSADRFLGLCNNFISMRTTDPITQEYVSSQFAQASVAQQQVRTGTQRDTSQSSLSFSAGYQETLMKTREDMFPPALLGDLPILQYVARLADGKKLKMKLPIIINKDQEGEVASWVD
jgi:conjugal transfer pilus assembly protein TraD